MGGTLAHSLVELVLLLLLSTEGTRQKIVCGRRVQAACPTWMSLDFSAWGQMPNGPVGQILNACIQCTSRAINFVTSAVRNNWLFSEQRGGMSSCSLGCWISWHTFFFFWDLWLVFSVWKCSGAIADPCMYAWENVSGGVIHMEILHRDMANWPPALRWWSILQKYICWNNNWGKGWGQVWGNLAILIFFF